MIAQEFVETLCPYCGEPIQLLVDCSVSHQEYIEDCSVCCQPIQVVARVDEAGIPAVNVVSENE